MDDPRSVGAMSRRHGKLFDQGAGAGSAAAISINADLVQDDVGRAMEGHFDTDASPSDRDARVE